MKSILCFLLFLLVWNDFLFAQEKQTDVEIKNKYTPVQLIPGSHNEFYILCEERIQKNVVSNCLFKFDRELKSPREEPLVIKSSLMKGDFLGTEIDIFTQETGPGEKPIAYLVKNDDYFLLLPDGTSKKIELDIPGKELKHKLAAIFADKNGLNILTIVGNETFPTGKLNWYRFSGKDNKQTKRTIELPLPPQIDKDNESGWRLNEVTEDGLYFYYVSYKNKVKDESRPILACHVVGVDSQGKAGKLVSMDLGLKSYNALTVNFTQNAFYNLRVDAPRLYDTGPQGTGHIPSDNAYLGVKIDGESRRIYLVVAQNDEVKVSNDGTIKSGAVGRAYPVKSLGVYCYDLDGNKLIQTKLKNTPPKLAALDDYSSMADLVRIYPLPAEEGVLIKLVNNSSGCFWHINAQGEEVMENKYKLPKVKDRMARYYSDLFAADYSCINDFNKSPYSLGGQSKVVQRLDKLPEDKKLGASYMSLDEVEILAIWDNKKNIMSLHSFTKN